MLDTPEAFFKKIFFFFFFASTQKYVYLFGGELLLGQFSIQSINKFIEKLLAKKTLDRKSSYAISY